VGIFLGVFKSLMTLSVSTFFAIQLCLRTSFAGIPSSLLAIPFPDRIIFRASGLSGHHHFAEKNKEYTWMHLTDLCGFALRRVQQEIPT
jgi:hypothetical protein